MTIQSPAVLGFIRGIGFALIMAAVTYLANATNLTFISNPAVAATIASLALALEHYLSVPASGGVEGKALFGAVKTR